ncbi:MAG TPA: hypothetical protein VG758_24295 [Hyphomicrobiaceae bacterium]|nr:hypothetical protein [Hyphomicrobiaceae bacterium]
MADAHLLKQMCADDRGHQHDYSVPPPLIRKDLIAALRDQGRDMLPPAINDCLQTTTPPTPPGATLAWW